MRKDSTSVIYIQYCYGAEHRTNLNTQIAIPPAYWSESKLSISLKLPPVYGDSTTLNKELKRQLRLAEDLVELAGKKGVIYKGHFVKEGWRPDLDISTLEKDEKKINELSVDKQAVNLDVYFQIDDYIKARRNKVSRSTITVYENMKSHLKAFELFRGKLFQYHTALIFGIRIEQGSLYELSSKNRSYTPRDKTKWQASFFRKESVAFTRVVHDYSDVKKRFVIWKGMLEEKLE